MADPKPAALYAILDEYREAMAILAERGICTGDSLPARLGVLLAMLDEKQAELDETRKDWNER